ncbi:hypothetical protein GOP47_0030375 [Adiantum capillus-veneris]|nr:hypothetical protein GOP47_0030375 [Adiantum capillus-veneris]
MDSQDTDMLDEAQNTFAGQGSLLLIDRFQRQLGDCTKTLIHREVDLEMRFKLCYNSAQIRCWESQDDAIKAMQLVGICSCLCEREFTVKGQSTSLPQQLLNLSFRAHEASCPHNTPLLTPNLST